jgi:AmmeMemoRadiSam system protein B
MGSKIREPAVAGLFYPEDATELTKVLTDLLDKNRPAKKYDNILGIVSPHAGYLYSGSSAALAYNVLKENSDFSTAIILSPSHHLYFNGCSIYDGDYYQTPLGNIPVNKNIAEFIETNSKNIFIGNKGHDKEHALEVQLPFLQMISDNFDIVPIIIGNQNAQYIQELSNTLAEIINEKIIIIASSDLSHFHSSEEAEKLDSVVINRIENFDYPGLYTDLANGKCEACGGGAIVALLETADIMGVNKTKVLSHTNSGDVTNDKSSVVGYLSAVIYNS